ncbi:SDR family mycofactocin-dependent oxidoreductase [Kribbella sp. VKM Ac-2527]|uniref:SDR family mycofactocin-dependent oxidoreductase n=1 Tax=Kribbella caucasensis TaxID=2512215 RepID=A0A4R6KKC4_9ACTN|nr:mycofactocin-coupled SDR family oxidoreductase [Kribbella sp. VKM Ac-2527]TDO51774.1 SDR family mycofactocin-dependent oxidoreductase [Kribbella sp. VKM Ac-2527]
MTARVALVTGAARGIGAATVRTLAAQGYGVVALDSCEGDDPQSSAPYPMPTRNDLAKVVDGLQDQVMPYVADVRDRDALKRAVTMAVDRWGRLDAAVASAAVIRGGAPLWQTPQSELDLLWQVDVLGVWNTAVAATPAMLANSDPAGCRFVAVASAAGTRGLYGLAGYGMAKHAVVGLVKGLAADLVGTGITAAAVSPGSTRTDMLDASADLYGLSSSEEFADSQLAKRLLEPDEIAAAIAFCCSHEGAVINGSVLHADGGFHA